MPRGESYVAPETLKTRYDGPSTSNASAANNNTPKEPARAENPLRGAARRRRTYRQRELRILREIKKLQNSTKRLIPRAAFARVIREITFALNTNVTHYTSTALEALQEATEMFVIHVLQDSYVLSMHRKSVTLKNTDIMLIRYLKLDL